MPLNQSNSAGSVDLNNLVGQAVSLRRGGDLAASAAVFERVLTTDPGHPGALASYAMLLLEMGDLQGAIRFGTRAVEADPRRMSAHHVLGQALCLSGSLVEGIERLRGAVALHSDAFKVHVHLGNALLEAGDLAGAERHVVIARDLAPTSAIVHLNLGNMYRKLGRPAAAIGAFQQAIALDSRLSLAYNNLGHVLSEMGDADGAITSFRQALAVDPSRAATWSNLMLALQRSDRLTAADVAAEHRAYGRYFGERIQQLSPRDVTPLAGRRLKIGYVSADFHNHAAALFIEPLLKQHDRQRFEIYCFHASKSSDELTRYFSTLVEHFVPVAGFSDLDLAEYIRAEEIDILVDLNGHTAGNRLPMFLLKPAPIQATWLGYLATTGLATIDYRITDPRADPPGLTEQTHTEKLWRLAHGLWCYQPYDFAPDVGPLPALRNGHVTFASLNSAAKVSRTVVELWSRILAAIPDSRMLLITESIAQRIDEVNQLFAEFGVAPERIEHLPRQPTVDYLALYNRIDVALDTWPYAGGTTTCDALWMGVPVVTLAGDRSFSRSGASVLWSAGLPELIAGTQREYVSCAVALATDVPRLGSLRSRLREQVRASPLTDAARFTTALEDAYIAMANRAQRFNSTHHHDNPGIRRQ